ncbi:MAG TPA: alpha/beta hydrolase [Ktedonobacteraceae bacterium]|nr:alpha/beta hydrolase [Ktedonobacteraceae bacterium]
MNKNIPAAPHTLQVNGIDLHYVTWGQLSKPEYAVLLVHGLTHNHMIWSELGPHLAERGWYPIAPDLRGRGWSSKPPYGIGIPFHVNDLLMLCDSLGLQRVHYIGHSLGALIGYFFAAVYPQRLSRFVAIDVGGRPSPQIQDILRTVLERLGRVYPSLNTYLQNMREESAPVHPWNDFWERYYRSDAEVQRDGTVTLRTSRAAIEEEMIVNATINIDMLLTAIRAPTLILLAGQGTRQPDWFVFSQEEAERVHGLIKGSSLERIPDGNHYTIILSKIFTRKVLDFLALGETTAVWKG